jgi:hypothetical protein
MAKTTHNDTKWFLLLLAICKNRHKRRSKNLKEKMYNKRGKARQPRFFFIFWWWVAWRSWWSRGRGCRSSREGHKRPWSLCLKADKLRNLINTVLLFTLLQPTLIEVQFSEKYILNWKWQTWEKQLLNNVILNRYGSKIISEC